jgi:hypothetical protein
MTCKLTEIFRRQGEYLASLEAIYISNGCFRHAEPFPWKTDDRLSQEEFRLLAWRCTEEVIEALEASANGDHNGYLDEIADIFHFFVELCLVSGVNPTDLAYSFTMIAPSPKTPDADLLDRTFGFCGSGRGDTIPTRWYCFIHLLGKAMMSFRQRPWRTDHRPTNRAVYVSSLSAAYFSLITACKRSGLDADGLYAAYFAKSKVNDQRTAEQKV